MSTASRTLAAFVLTLCAPLVSAPAQATVADPAVIAHRGAVVAGVTENTLPAFALGVAHGKVTETDVQWSSDQWAMMLHDPTLDRTTACSGRLSATTGRAARACGVMTFGAFLRYMQTNRDGIDLELKAEGTTARQAREVLSELTKYGLTERVTVSSFYPANLRTLRAQPGGAKVRTALIDSTTVHTAAEAKALGNTTAIRLDKATPARVRALHAAGVKVWVWTARSDADLAAAKSLGVDGVIVDDPAAAARYFAAH